MEDDSDTDEGKCQSVALWGISPIHKNWGISAQGLDASYSDEGFSCVSLGI